MFPRGSKATIVEAELRGDSVEAGRRHRTINRRPARARRDDGSWYIGDDDGFSKAENLLVTGTAEMILRSAVLGTSSVR